MSKYNIISWTLKHRTLKEIANRVADVAVGWLVRPFSFITPRNKKKWVIGNKTGWNDNSKYFHIYLAEYENEIRPIWICKTRKERDLVRSKGLEVYRKWSIKGLYHTMTSGAFIFSSGVHDINYWASGKVVKFNLWHGVGVKKLGMKSSDLYDPSKLLTRILTPFFYDQSTRFIGPSDMMAQHFADCYRLSNEQMLKVGYPRCEFILSNQANILTQIRKYENEEIAENIERLKKYEKVYIYMPTFRDAQTDFIEASGIDFKVLNDLLVSKNQILILKLHPATRIKREHIFGMSNIVILDKNMDVYPILPFTDVLITDYSSIYYDYILMENKGIILFPFDYDEYIKNSRDLAFDYLTYTPGCKAWNFEELYRLLSSESKLVPEERSWVIKQFWGDNYMESNKKIFEALKGILKI